MQVSGNLPHISENLKGFISNKLTNRSNFTANMCEKSHRISGTGNRTHGHLNTSLFPLPLDQGLS